MSSTQIPTTNGEFEFLIQSTDQTSIELARAKLAPFLKKNLTEDEIRRVNVKVRRLAQNLSDRYKKCRRNKVSMRKKHWKWLESGVKMPTDLVPGLLLEPIEPPALPQGHKLVKCLERTYYVVGTTDVTGMGTELKYSGSLERSDPQKFPVTIIGQLEHLKALPFDLLKTKLEPRVSEETFKFAVLGLTPSPTDSCPLYLNLATVIALPKACTRFNTPSRAHALTKAVKNSVSSVDEFLVIVCEKADYFASGCAVARAFPLYSRKSSAASREGCTVTIEFILVSKSSDTNEISLEEKRLNEAELNLLQNSAFGIRNTAKIIDAPPNEMHTDQFIIEAVEIGKKLGIEPTIIRDEELSKKGFGGIYSVGQASVHPPALVVLSHKPAGATRTVAWVGKGIVYDTGGLSIKSKTGMPSMKRDCGGAAAVLNAFYVAVREGFTENLHAVLCLAENSVGPKSTRPDDIIHMYSGKTVEVNNTDAEGRLVLGDGVAYAKKDLGADMIVDMATLTGAQGVATGKYHAAILTNSEEWERNAVKAGTASGDLTYPIVFAPEFHFSEFNSAVADMKNSAADRSNALASCAGLFIMSHIGFDFPGLFMHIDIASPVDTGERATGYGVALLNTLFGHYSSNAVLQSLSPATKTSKSSAQ